ncbi:MAG: hypothetical protein U1C56_00820, partial [Candidatus Curtissbacteria bacterium]|nr:hypothetical protein [Candidatus Curtissbacteria bacterium]
MKPIKSPVTEKWLKSFRKYLIQNYSKRCKTFLLGCHCCEMWYLCYDLLEIDSDLGEGVKNNMAKKSNQSKKETKKKGKRK